MATIKIDGHDITAEYKAHVSKLEGLQALPVRPLRRTTWEGVHGTHIHREARRFDSRKITLELTFRAESSDARTRAASLRALLYPTGRPLRLELYNANGEAEGVYDVDTESETLTDIIYEEMLTTQIVFVEAEPIKNIYVKNIYARPGINATAQFTITTPEVLTISWGDGSYSEDIGTGTYEHTYTDGKDGHFIIVSGNFENVTITPTTGTTLYKTIRQ